MARRRLRARGRPRLGLVITCVFQDAVPGAPALRPDAMFTGLADLGHAWLGFMNPTSIALGLGGALLGIIVGILPGLSATLVIALLTTLTIKLPANDAILVLICSYVGALYGGSRTAILLEHPRHRRQRRVVRRRLRAGAARRGRPRDRHRHLGRLHRHAVRRALPGRVHAVAGRGRARVRRVRVLLARALRRRACRDRSSATTRSRAG